MNDTYKYFDYVAQQRYSLITPVPFLYIVTGNTIKGVFRRLNTENKVAKMDGHFLTNLRFAYGISAQEHNNNYNIMLHEI